MSMKFIGAALMLALWHSPAGAQPAQSPEQLLEQYTSTGDGALLDLCRLAVASLPRGPRAQLLQARILLLSGETGRALRKAAELNREMRDELDAYALSVGASRMLGDGRRAE